MHINLVYKMINISMAFIQFGAPLNTSDASYNMLSCSSNWPSPQIPVTDSRTSIFLVCTLAVSSLKQYKIQYPCNTSVCRTAIATAAAHTERRNLIGLTMWSYTAVRHVYNTVMALQIYICTSIFTKQVQKTSQCSKHRGFLCKFGFTVLKILLYWILVSDKCFSIVGIFLAKLLCSLGVALISEDALQLNAKGIIHVYSFHLMFFTLWIYSRSNQSTVAQLQGQKILKIQRSNSAHSIVGGNID